MATVISSTVVRNNSSQRVTWTWVDGSGATRGPNIAHIPLGADAQAFADYNEVRDAASLVAYEIEQNLQEIAD